MPQTAASLLAIAVDRPDRLFSGNDDVDKQRLNRLRAQWHPDRHGGSAEATAVFQHLNALYVTRTKQLADGSWQGRGTVSFGLPNNQTLRVNYLRQRVFELGRVYHCKNSLIFVSDGTNTSRDLFSNGVRRVRELKYADTKMEHEFARFMPVVKTVHTNVSVGSVTGPVVVLEKPEDLISLRDLLEHVGGKLDPKHVTWIMSRLHGLTSFLEWAQLTHNALDLDNFFVNPVDHTGYILGGWWYARPHKEPLQYLPASSATVWRSLPSDVTKAKVARHRLDRESIRLMGRQLLGDGSGTRLLRDPAVPSPLRTWLIMPAGESAFTDFEKWVQVRDSSFPRQFIELPVCAEDIYASA